MVERGSRPGAGDSPGILHSLKMLGATLASAFHTRVELFVTELEEERERLKQTLSSPCCRLRPQHGRSFS